MKLMAEASKTPLIEIKDLRKVFDTPAGKVVALDGINLSIDKGEIFGLIGMSGAGKSTLVRCINLLERPTEGSVIVEGDHPDMVFSVYPNSLRAGMLRMSSPSIFSWFTKLFIHAPPLFVLRGK